MTHEEITKALVQLGFTGGWVLTGNEITVWENSAPQPTQAELEDALAAVKAEEATAAALKAEQKAGLLARLGITEEEAELLLG